MKQKLRLGSPICMEEAGVWTGTSLRFWRGVGVYGATPERALV
jgi:hypothetical protein